MTQLVTWHNLIQGGILVSSCFGVWLTGTNLRWGWRYAIGTQVLMWLPYSLVTRQWGLAGMALVFTALYVRNLRRWAGSHSTPRDGQWQREAYADTP